MVSAIARSSVGRAVSWPLRMLRTLGLYRSEPLIQLLPRDRHLNGVKTGEDSTWLGGSPAPARKMIISIHAVELRLRRLIRTNRFVNEVCVESGNCLFEQVG
jgi:hypothetical protein